MTLKCAIGLIVGGALQVAVVTVTVSIGLPLSLQVYLVPLSSYLRVTQGHTK